MVKIKHIFKAMYTDSKSYDKLILPQCTGITVLDSTLESVLFTLKTSTVFFEPKMITSDLKHKCIVRAKTGGGIVRFPWKHKISTGELKPVTSLVFSVGQGDVAVLSFCD